MSIGTHLGHKFKTRGSDAQGYVPYIFIGPPHWWRVNRGIVYSERKWAELQAKWAIDDYCWHGKTLSLSILPERRNR